MTDNKKIKITINEIMYDVQIEFENYDPHFLTVTGSIELESDNLQILYPFSVKFEDVIGGYRPITKIQDGIIEWAGPGLLVSEINKISISHEVIHNAICPKRFFTLFDGEFTSSIDAYRKIFNQAVDISCNLISYIGDGSSENKELNLNNIKTDSLKINSLLLFKSDREKFESLIESCKRLDQHKAKRKLDVITSSGPCHLVNTNLYQVFQFSSLNAEEIKSLSFKRNGEYRILNQDEFKRSVEMIEEIHDPIGNFKSIHEAKQYILIHFSLFDYVYIIRCLNGASTG